MSNATGRNPAPAPMLRWLAGEERTPEVMVSATDKIGALAQESYHRSGDNVTRSGEDRLQATDDRSVACFKDEQRRRNLAKANEVRLGRVAWKRRVQSREILVSELLRDCPDLLRATPIVTMMGWAPRWGKAAVTKMLTEGRTRPVISDTLCVADVSPSTLEELIDRCELKEERQGISRQVAA